METLAKQLVEFIEDECIIYAPWQWRDKDKALRKLSEFLESKVGKSLDRLERRVDEMIEVVKALKGEKEVCDGH